MDFEANARDGFGTDWPIRFADIAPWYDYVERFVGISGQEEGLASCPDGAFLSPMQLKGITYFAMQKPQHCVFSCV